MTASSPTRTPRPGHGPARSGSAREPGPGRDDEHINTVGLVGRVAAPAQLRVLPSGDELAVVRLVVRRPPGGRSGGTVVDTLDCVAWSAGLRRRVVTWQAGDVVAVQGALRRRFWRAPGGAAVSRCEVEITAARRVRRATMAG